MHPNEHPAQPGPSSQAPWIINTQTSRARTPSRPDVSPITPPERPSEQPAQSSSPEPETVDTHYKIVCSDCQEYSLSGNVYIKYIVPPIRESTGWFCIVAFYWHDVQAEFECVYHPTIKLFEDFKPIEGSLEGGKGGIQDLHISMWNFADRGPDLNPKHAVMDDNGNRIMLVIMILRDGSAVKLYGKLVRDGDDEKEVWLSADERRRLRMPP